MGVEQGGDGLGDGPVLREKIGHARIQPRARRSVKKDKMSCYKIDLDSFVDEIFNE
jgi:hypothetical protein